MIESGREWQVRQLIECALAQAATETHCEAPTQREEQITRAAYAHGVADILRVVVGDSSDDIQSSVMQSILERYSESL